MALTTSLSVLSAAAAAAAAATPSALPSPSTLASMTTTDLPEHHTAPGASPGGRHRCPFGPVHPGQQRRRGHRAAGTGRTGTRVLRVQCCPHRGPVDLYPGTRAGRQGGGSLDGIRAPGRAAAPRRQLAQWRRLLEHDRHGRARRETPIEALYDETTGLPR